MAVNTTTLVNAVQTRVDGITASCDNKDILLAAVAANRAVCAEGHKKVTVPTLNDLPNLDTSGVGVGPGHMVFVESINVPVVSTCNGWYGLDRRVARKDVPERRLWLWGAGGYGRLGNGSTSNQYSPVTTCGGGTNWRQVGLGGYSSAAIKTDGTLWSWGRNLCGQLGTGNTTHQYSPVTTAGGGTTWCQVAKGFDHSFAIKTDGTLWAWGYNDTGVLGTGNATAYYSPVTTAGGGTNWCRISLFLHWGGTAIKTDGTLWMWGWNNYGQLGTGNTTWYNSPVTTAGGGTNWCYSSGGYYHASAIKTNGTLWAWGTNGDGRLGTGNTTSYSSPVTTAGGGTNWCQVAGGCAHTLAIKTDGTLWAWGDNTYGQLGTGNTSFYSSPVTTVGGGTNWYIINSGVFFSTAIKTDGTLWVWGANSYGQLGTGNTSFYSSPVTTVAGGTNWCNIDTGYNFTAAITSTL